ncbi:hypothetical protein PAL_GLEAN10022899 [Pteropus alecto]|uniref:Uncharacterized protein n=1 Tax=Pteropus alecto TaxID=9402 RepID=L5K4C4_PTEAL|nr:hypothetical protein PAL_GLEAN10022899 [Pteropus alecto]
MSGRPKQPTATGLALGGGPCGEAHIPAGSTTAASACLTLSCTERARPSPALTLASASVQTSSAPSSAALKAAHPAPPGHKSRGKAFRHTVGPLR